MKTNKSQRISDAKIEKILALYRKGLSMRAVAKKVGVSHSTVSRYV